MTKSIAVTAYGNDRAIVEGDIYGFKVFSLTGNNKNWNDELWEEIKMKEIIHSIDI